MWEGLLGGLGDFAKSGLGQTVIGAGLGYGADRLSGGDGGIGALAGGALGGLNAYSNGGGLFGDSYSGSMVDKATSGLFGSAGKNINAQGIDMSYAPTGNATQDMAVRQVGNIASPQQGLLSNAQNFYKQNEGLFDFGKDAFKTYGDYTKNQSSADMNQAQMNYIQSLQREQEAENLYKRNARNQMQSNIDTGYAGSSLSNYYTP